MSSRSALPPGPSLPAALQMVGFWTRPLAFMDRCRARYGKRFTIRIPSTPPFAMSIPMDLPSPSPVPVMPS